MPQKSASLQYVLLALAALLGLIHIALGVGQSYQDLARGTTTVAQLFSIGPGSRTHPLSPSQAQAAHVPTDFTLATILSTDDRLTGPAPRPGDAIYTLDSIPLTSRLLRDQILARHHPGENLDVTYWKAGTPLDAQPLHARIRLLPERDGPPSVLAWTLGVVFSVLPAFCLATGWYVVLARPRSAYSWLILGILGYVSALLLHPLLTTGLFLPFSLIWITLGQAAMALCFMLFGIYFPERAPIDIRLPWIKWLVLIPICLLVPFDLYSRFTLVYSFHLYGLVSQWDTTVNNVENIVSTLGIFYAFYCIQSKLHQPDLPPDARRRLKVLNTGSTIGLTPLLVLLIVSLVRGVDFGLGVPSWFELSVLGLLFVFPLTLAYVVIVQRAMDVRILVRQGTKYFFAKQSIFIFGVLLAAFMAYNLSVFFASRQHRLLDVIRILGIVAWFIAFRAIGAKRMQRKIDEKFFREVYSAEQLLSELSDDARTFTEVAPLLKTIASRLGATLHIDRIAVFLRTGEVFQLQFATGLPLVPGYIAALPATSATITNLSRGKLAPANVYRDDPSSWLVDATEAERAALADLSTELLVPLPGRKRLVGVIALGPKSSEEPYTKSDRQLLQSVASQTGLALENAELLESLTAELDLRARIKREGEIAREVQERLFPQTYPCLPGIDLAGFCRPAHAVGGDYYDVFLIPAAIGSPTSGRLALAIGDISGKGVSAALLMASLRAALRSVATLQQPEGNRHIATLMQHINRLVYEASTSNRYATFFYAELDPATRLLTYVNAGHNCPVVLRGEETIQLQPTGTVIGLLEDATYDQATLQLQPGDTILAFTDGISEAMTADEEEWGEDRMTAAAQRLLIEHGSARSARQFLECLLAETDIFTAGAPQHDDMTLLVATVA